MSTRLSRRDEIHRGIEGSDHSRPKHAGVPVASSRRAASNDARCRSRGIRSRGFTMIELMIAMTIGVFLLGTLALVLSNNSRTRYEIEKSIGQIQNARYAMQMITDDLSNAGFYGEAHHTRRRGAAEPLSDRGESRRGTWLSGSGRGQYRSTAADLCRNRRRPDRQRSSRGATHEHLCRRRSGLRRLCRGLPHLQQPACSADCLDPPKCSPWIATGMADLTARVRSCTAGADAPIYRLYSRLYYLAPSNRPNDGIPTLKRADLTAERLCRHPDRGGGRAFAFRIRNRQRRHGRAERIPGRIVDPGDWQDVVAVRVHLLVRNATPTHGHLDDRTYRLGQEVIGRRAMPISVKPTAPPYA
jgi:type IV pilus assembly protein PilW